MEYIIIGLLTIVLILLIVILIKVFKKKDHKENLDMLERLSRFEVNVTKEIGDFKSELSKEIISDFTKMDNAIEMRMDSINKKVHERIDQNFVPPEGSPAAFWRDPAFSNAQMRL